MNRRPRVGVRYWRIYEYCLGRARYGGILHRLWGRLATEAYTRSQLEEEYQ